MKPQARLVALPVSVEALGSSSNEKASNGQSIGEVGAPDPRTLSTEFRASKDRDSNSAGLLIHG
jgi:hypothetical protein